MSIEAEENVFECPNFDMRHYQQPIWDVFKENILKGEGNINHIIINGSRRSGKDKLSCQMLLAKAAQEVGTYLYLFPNINAARRTMIDTPDIHSGMTKRQENFDHVTEKFNSQTMRLELKNGSVIIFGGAKEGDRYRGMGVKGAVLSEYAHYDSPNIDAILSPQLRETNGFKITITTPNGYNFFHNLVQNSHYDDRTKYFNQPVSETKHMTAEQLESAKQDLINSFGKDIGNMLFQQEYHVEFHAGSIGSVYSTEDIDGILSEDHIFFDPNYKIYAIFDLGWKDNTAIWIMHDNFAHICVLDSYQNNRKDHIHYCDWIKENWGEDVIVVLPHDGKRRTMDGEGVSIAEKIEMQGLAVENLGVTTIHERIMCVRSFFPVIKMNKGLEGETSLRNYSYKLLKEQAILSTKPIHDRWSDYADSFGYGIQFLEIKRNKSSAVKKIKNKQLPIDFGNVWNDY